MVVVAVVQTQVTKENYTVRRRDNGKGCLSSTLVIDSFFPFKIRKSQIEGEMH